MLLKKGKVLHIQQCHVTALNVPTSDRDRISSTVIMQYQFGCGILKMVGPKKQNLCPKINILKGNHCILRIRGATARKIGHDFRK